MQGEAHRKSGFEVALEVWERRKWLAILVFGGAFAAAVSIITFLPDFYRSSATVLVEDQQIPETFVKSTVTGALETRLQTISQEILSRSRLESLINRFDLYTELRQQISLEEVIEGMRRDIQLELKRVERRDRDRATVAFTISFGGSDPQKVALVTNTLASFYIEENLKARERQAVGTAQFLRGQLGEVQKKLDEQERRVSEFRERNIGELPEQQGANLATLERLNAQLRLNSDNQIRIGERRAALVKQLAEAQGYGPPSTPLAGAIPVEGPDATIVRITQRIAELNQQVTELRTHFSDKYPDVVRAKLELAALEEQLNKAKEEKLSRAKGDSKPEKEAPVLPNPIVLQLKKDIDGADVEMKALRAEAESLRRSTAIYQQRVENAPRREQEFQALARDYEATKESYRSLLKRREEAQLSESMEQRQKGEQFRILDPALATDQPAAPNRPRLIAFGLLLSLGVAGGAVVLAEGLDTSFHKVDDLRAFSPVPVLVSIPRIVTAADSSRGRWRFGLAATSAMLALVLIVSSSYLIAKGKVPLVGPFAQTQLLKR